MPIKPFIPKKLPIHIKYENFIAEITKAHRAIATLNSSLNHLPNPKILGRTLQTKEAVLSSKIEGTQVSFNEVLQFEAQLIKKEETNKQKDYQEIINYRNALNFGVQYLKKGLFDDKLFQKMNAILLRSERGLNKTPGKYRNKQVYIGKIGVGIEQASYVPPPADKINYLMNNLQAYLNSKNEKDLLVQIAVAHYQFEAIHPFLDGNGRVGRLLISLFLHKKKMLKHPFLYLSEFFEKNRSDYYALLSGVSDLNDIESWLKFFLYALTNQAQKADKTSSDILKLYIQVKEEIMDLNLIYAINLLDAIFIHPVFTTASIRQDAKIKNTQTFFNLVKKFVKKGIIIEKNPKQRRNKIYVFRKLVKIINE